MSDQLLRIIEELEVLLESADPRATRSITIAIRFLKKAIEDQK